MDRPSLHNEEEDVTPYKPTPDECELETIILACLTYYGPVLWKSRVWYGYMPPRDRRLNRVNVLPAGECAYPILPNEGGDGQGKKEAGYLPRKEVENS